MERAVIEQKVKDAIEENMVESAEIKPDSNLINDLGLDTMDVLEVMMTLEEEFEIEIPDEDTEGLLTVKNVVDYVDSKIQ